MIVPVAGLHVMSATWPAVRNFRHAHDLTLATVAAQNDGRVEVLWSDVRFCWDAGSQPPSEGQPVLVAEDGRRVACGLWFGGEVDADGRLVRQIVRVGTWVQARR